MGLMDGSGLTSRVNIRLVPVRKGAEVKMMIVEVLVGTGAGAAPPASISNTVRCCPESAM